MKIAFALYVALIWTDTPRLIDGAEIHVPDPNRQIIDLRKTYETEQACLSACAALQRSGGIPSGLDAPGRRYKALIDYFCIQVPSE